MIVQAIRRGPLYFWIVILGAIFFAPFAWLITSSLKSEQEIFAIPPSFFPSQIEWDNYPYALSQFPFLGALANTMTIIVFVLVGATLTASMAAYAFARLRLPFKGPLFVVVLSTMMIPYHVTLIPQYMIFRDLGWLDTLKPLIVPSFFGGGAFYIFLLRQFFLTIPRDYDEAARVDGCGMFGIYWRIILPLSLPALGVVAIYLFLSHWNDFFGPLIYLNSQSSFTLALAYMTWERGPQHLGFKHTWSHIMAVGTLLTIPPLLIFFAAQRYFIQGIVVTGLKG
jgi:ABC-type glycerol-3-phosphate transport system permease component